MIVVDGSCLVETLVGGARASMVSARLLTDGDLVAPHVIDVEAFGVIRDLWVQGLIDETTALMAVEDLRAGPAERFGHGPLLDRAWPLRDTFEAATPCTSRLPKSWVPR